MFLFIKEGFPIKFPHHETKF